ncbi:YfhO family protein [Chitinophaga sp. Ak27]|uniref:YfhO family protein n=1 Tax=Chitinophaga sp. Ak27 TaxID=2726116 RepID=UPI00145D0A53|nr:YfhO family protein [Chitinophaga sp. Ak27]NLU95524.1 YfhO family protein [Chitinophaga sp. Ak27]
MKHTWLKALTVHVAALVIFVALAFAFCSPVLEGKQLFQSDMMHYKGMQKEAADYYQSTGDLPLWTNSMFGGMPTYVIYTGPSTNQVAYLNKIFTLGLPNPVDMFFVLMMGMYLFLCVIDVKYWIRIAGAIAYGFATFTVVSMDAGHITKVMSMAYMAPVLGGMILAYRGKYVAGAVLTALAAAVQIYNNHPQITYYTLIMAICLAVAAGVQAWRQQQIGVYFKASAVLVMAGILAVLPAMDNLLIMNEYTHYTIRGSQSELTLNQKDKDNKKSGGLDIDYAFQWSYGKGETFTLLLPHLVGGSTGEKLSTSSYTYKALTDIGVPAVKAEEAVNSPSWQLYWGAQPFTSGPAYVGVIICFLFVLSLFIVNSWHKWWLVAATVIGVVLSWGANFPELNNFLFYHLPLYSKFRAPTMALAIPQVSMVILACMALQELVYGDAAKAFLQQHLKMALFVTGGLVIILAIGGSVLYPFSGPGDASFLARYSRMLGGDAAAAQLLGALKRDRSAILRADGFRALALILVAFAALWYFLKGKLKATYAVIIVAAVTWFDLFQLDKTYMNEDNFSEPTQLANYIAPSAADEQILQDKDPYYRVLNATTNPFLDANTSYFHKSVGGQSPAKLWIYEDLIEHQLSKNNMAVLNMLNTRYFIVADPKSGQPVAQRNPGALGNAWFVKAIQWAPDANSEMKALDHFNPKDTAIVDQRFKATTGPFTPAADSSARIVLTKYGLNQLQYTAQNSAEGLGIFSDIYYPAGWKAYIDGKETPIIRVNYALRGLKIPAGKHDIQFKFEPATFFLGRKISGFSSILLLVLIAGGIVWSLWPSRIHNA